MLAAVRGVSGLSGQCKRCDPEDLGRRMILSGE
jgi:hypothetical protein